VTRLAFLHATPCELCDQQPASIEFERAWLCPECRSAFSESPPEAAGVAPQAPREPTLAQVLSVLTGGAR